MTHNNDIFITNYTGSRVHTLLARYTEYWSLNLAFNDFLRIPNHPQGHSRYCRPLKTIDHSELHSRFTRAGNCHVVWRAKCHVTCHVVLNLLVTSSNLLSSSALANESHSESEIVIMVKCLNLLRIMRNLSECCDVCPYKSNFRVQLMIIQSFFKVSLVINWVFFSEFIKLICLLLDRHVNLNRKTHSKLDIVFSWLSGCMFSIEKLYCMHIVTIVIASCYSSLNSFIARAVEIHG